MTRLPQLELECMRALWSLRAATVAEVRAALARPLAYTTVLTVLDRMAAKGVVGRKKRGRAFVYEPLLDVETARQEAIARLLASLFENDREALLSYIARFRGEGPRTATRPRARRAAAAAAFVPSIIDDSLL